LGGKTEAVARTLGINRFEQLLELRDWQGDPLAQERQRFAFRRNGRVENDIGEQAAEQGAGGVLEVIAVTLARGLAAEPADHRLNIEQSAIARGLDPIEGVERIGIGIFGVKRHHAVVKAPPGRVDQPDDVGRGIEADQAGTPLQG